MPTNAPTPPRPEDEAVARLEALIAYLYDPVEHWENHKGAKQQAADLRLVLSALASRAEEIAALREALEPFANHPVLGLFPNAKDTAQAPTSQWQNPLTMRDFRRVARALTPGREGGNG